MPVWVVTGSISMPVIVPATARLFLTMACDLILVLIRSFREVTFRNSEGQPTERDVSAAARIYRIKGYSHHVHKDVKKLVPRKNLAASYKYERIQRTVEDMMEQYRGKLMSDVDMPTAPESRAKKLSLSLRGSGKKNSGDAESVNSSIPDINSPLTTNSDSEDGEDERDFYSQLHEAHTKAVELEARRPMAELPQTKDPVEMESPDIMRAELSDTQKPRYELEGTSKAAELDGTGSVSKVHELQG